FMKRASVAAGPRIGVAVPSPGATAGAAAAGALAPLPLIAASTSSLVTRPRGPLPAIALTSSPCALALRAATGGAFSAPLLGGGRLGGGGGLVGGGGVLASGALPCGLRSADCGPPTVMRHNTVPVGIVSSA